MLELVVTAILIVVITLFFLLRKKANTENTAEPIPNHQNSSSQSPSVVPPQSDPQAESKPAKKKKKKAESESATAVSSKSPKELEESYPDLYYGSLPLRSSKNISTLTALAVKHSKVLVANSRNELVLFDLRKWKIHSSFGDPSFTSLGNNTATALAITQQHYFAALDFEKTIVGF